MNVTRTVNEPRLKGAQLERALLGRLRDLLAGLAWLRSSELARGRGQAADRIVRLRVPSSEIRAELHVHCKDDLRPGAFAPWAGAQPPPKAGTSPSIRVLAMRSVSERMAETVRSAGWSWFDLAGNCWLDVPGILRVERTGNAPAHRPPRPTANLGTAASARVLRVLLAPEHAGKKWNQRFLRLLTRVRGPRGDPPVSLGLVNKVVAHLREEGFVEAIAFGRGIRVRDPVGLLEAWRRAYRFDRHQQHAFFTLLKTAELTRALDRVGLESGGCAAYAAFSAAERQAPQVRQVRTWLYVEASCLDLLLRHTEAKAVDSGENLVVLVPEDPGVFMTFGTSGQVGDQQLKCTDPVQTYLDLWHCGGRGEEAAKAILEQRILAPWRDAGLP